jgi:uncharacterized RDD family membrane protein YckC
MPNSPIEDSTLLDSRVVIETPEGVELSLAPAGPVSRAVAWLLDALIRTAVYIAGSMVLAALGGLGTGLLLLLLFLMEWFYPVLFEVLRDGQTPGKRAMGIAVRKANGTPVDWPSALVRNLLRTVDFLPLLYGVGLVAMLLNRRLQRLGDLAADTLVVHQRAAQSPGTLPAGRPVPPNVALGSAEVHALVAFAERISELRPERAAELAAQALPLGETGRPPSPERLVGMAHWLLGNR